MEALCVVLGFRCLALIKLSAREQGHRVKSLIVVRVFRDKSVDNFKLQWSFSRQMRWQTSIPRAERRLRTHVDSKQAHCQVLDRRFSFFPGRTDQEH